jgi:hypothetical protein
MRLTHPKNFSYEEPYYNQLISIESRTCYRTVNFYLALPYEVSSENVEMPPQNNAYEGAYN